MRRSVLRLGTAMSVAGLGGIAHASETAYYTYDALGRLTATNVIGGPSGGVTLNTSFDPAGNRTNYSVVGSSGSASVYDPGANMAWTWNSPPPRNGGATFDPAVRPHGRAFMQGLAAGAEGPASWIAISPSNADGDSSVDQPLPF